MSLPAGAGGGASLLLRGVTLPDGRLADVRLGGARIEAIGAPGTLARADAPDPGTTLDLSGHLLLPAPAEPHAHLDKAYTAERAPNPDGDLGGAVTAWLRYRPSMSDADITARGSAAVRAYLANGVTAIRTHVDVGDDIGIRALSSVIAIRNGMVGRCDLQVVAFVSTPVSGRAGARNRALLNEALAAGADVAGACPALDPEPALCIDACLEVAAEHAAPVDLHIDEWLEPDPCTLALLADAVTSSGFPFGVVASHCVSLGMMAPDVAREIAERVAAARIAVICLPLTNLYLQARAHPVAMPRGLTALRTLRAAGVTVAAGGDNLQDPFNRVGRADPLDTATLLVLAGHDTPEIAYASVSAAARSAMGLSEVDIVAGAPAELLAIRAGSVGQAVAESAPDRVVIHAGRVVARTSTTREFFVPGPGSGAQRTMSTARRPG
ncbi:MAG: cytosine/creatinine deaminase [Micromonosporaceae bacterium]|jgi:cytosine deaminase|nr:cytosine/creatinine deaminase [Micromonosporaceae bacterium]